MKKVINGKMYNTETAKSVAYHNNGLPHNDIYFWEAELFLKKTGEFFLCTDRIIPLTEKEAKEWCEEHLTGEEYVAIFGDVEE